MKRQVISILGSNGMLGSDLAPILFKAGYLVRCWKRPTWDICSQRDIERAVREVDVVINCAAYTDVNRAQKDRSTAYLVNKDAARNVAVACEKFGTYGIHFSTDYVFDGFRQSPYKEEDRTNPLNYYGRSKLAGEQEFLRIHPGGCAIRLQWSYGSNGYHFLNKLLSLAQRKGSLQVVDDQFGAPTSTADIASMVLRLLEVRPSGLFHFAAEGETSRFGVACLLVRQLGLTVPVFGCSSVLLPNQAPRPKNSTFDCSKIDAVLGLQRSGWEESITQFIASEYTEWGVTHKQEVSA
jgi:dTDP-4-dehydrorhamnose reductase